MKAETAKPIVVCPNLGQYWESVVGGLAGGTPESDLLRRVPEWLELGVAHIGGCCGVGPGTIAAFAGLSSAQAGRSTGSRRRPPR
jgi:homocysteine S-methyltransferase